MIKNKLFGISLLAITAIAVLPAQADDLAQVYRQAVSSDPTFKKAYSDWLSFSQNLPLAKAGFYPSVGVSANLAPSYQWSQDYSGSTPKDSSGYTLGGNNNVQVNLEQKIFDFANWKKIDSASFTVKAATAKYLASYQDLLFRTAQAYFMVLSASEKLQFIVAQTESMQQQLATQQQKYDVGLIAITDLYDARAKYDNSLASQIQAQHDLINALEDLRAITGKSYTALLGLKKDIPLIMPKPDNIDAWVSSASQHSYNIQADLNQMLAAQQDIKVAKGGRYPVVTLRAGAEAGMNGYGIDAPSTSHGTVHDYGENVSAGLKVDLPVYQGGSVGLTVKQREYDYLSASHQLELTHRNVERDTRQAYLGLKFQIVQIQADQEAILSSQNQLEATKAGHVVGTRTILDVLQAVSSLSESKQNWAKDRYDYLINLISLKKNAGTLSAKDLVQINAWLSNPVAFDLKTPVKTQPRKKVVIAAINTKTLKKKAEDYEVLPTMDDDIVAPSPSTQDKDDKLADSDLTPSSKDKVAASSETASPPPSA